MGSTSPTAGRRRRIGDAHAFPSTGDHHDPLALLLFVIGGDLPFRRILSMTFVSFFFTQAMPGPSDVTDCASSGPGTPECRGARGQFGAAGTRGRIDGFGPATAKPLPVSVFARSSDEGWCEPPLYQSTAPQRSRDIR